MQELCQQRECMRTHACCVCVCWGGGIACTHAFTAALALLLLLRDVLTCQSITLGH